MTIVSMTGFARAEGHDGPLSWAWELKSVNSKSLDLRFRLPPGYDALELPLRALVTQRLKRGAISAGLSVARAGGTGNIRVNREALAVVMKLANDLAAEIEAAPPRIDGLLALRGVLESGDEAPDEATRERQMKLLNDGFVQALEGLGTMRASEGARLDVVLSDRLNEIAALVKDAEGAAAMQPAAIKARLKELIAALTDAVPALPEERLAHEAALLVAKADIREELDRLKAHIDAAQSLMKEGVAVGRRFDFLCQEFNREANTLCSKSADLELTRIGLALKAAIEQLREQVQNIE
ncbi:MAG TPA: YicC/YloC family endoribonuclease [Stellaceae bacterium]|nr:YicC/YloC family endoribonuclease [Stellaceae bacterium]